jgi:hypothetical protein
MKKIAFTVCFITLMMAQAISQEQEKKIYVHHGFYASLIESPGYYEGTSFNDSYWNMDSEWKKGTIYSPDGTQEGSMTLRYNLTRDRFEAKKDNDKTIYFVNPDSISKIRRMRELFIYSAYDPGDDMLAKGYFKVLIDGKTKLLFKKREERKYGKKGAFGYDAFKTFVSEYYLKKDGERIAQKVKKNKKSILAALSDKRDEVETYAALHKLKFTKEKDLSAILTYYDRLKEQPEKQ